MDAFSRQRTLGLPVAAILLTGMMGLVCSSTCRSGEVILKSGFVIPGRPISVPGITGKVAAQIAQGPVPPSPSYYMVSDNIRRYFVHRRNLKPGPEGVNASDEISKYVTFRIKPLLKRTGGTPVSIGGFLASTPWDEYGHRRVTLGTSSSPEHIHLAITLIHPHFLKVESTSHRWEFGIHPAQVSPSLLRQIIHSAIDTDNPDRRLDVVLYFLQAGIFSGAREELAEIEQRFPELKGRVADMQQQLNDLYGSDAIAEVNRRRAVGQHEIAYNVAKRITREDLSAVTLRAAQEVVDDYERALERITQARTLLGVLQGELKGADAQKFAPIRAVINDELNYDSLPRLEPFLQTQIDDSLAPSEKLALACSGWVVGPTHAVTKLNEALALWESRFLVVEYLRPATDYGDRKGLLDALTLVEGASVENVSRMVPYLPLPIDLATTLPMQTDPNLPSEAKVFQVEIPETDTDPASAYAVQLPPGYTPTRSYPLLIVLRAEGRSLETTLDLWAGSNPYNGVGQKNGYIVIAPEYTTEDARYYEYTPFSHDAVIAALNDVRRRFQVDSDRVYLAGNGMGGDASLDIGMAHPDLWAGIVSFTSRIDKGALNGMNNSPLPPLYMVGGARDRDCLDKNDSSLTRLMQRGNDVVYCEYEDRGFESYAEEIPRIFDWMSLYRRDRQVKEWELNIIRSSDARVAFCEATNLPDFVMSPNTWDKFPRRLSFEFKIRPGNSIEVRRGGSNGTVWLSPDLIRFDETVRVSLRSATKFNEIPRPSLEDLLDDLRERGDRQLLYWLKILL